MPNKVKLALCLIVKGTKEEAEALDNCLKDQTSAYDGIFVTITHEKGYFRNSDVDRICQKYEATVSDFEWVHDFAAARNFNFSQVSDDFTHIAWCDADDALRGAEQLRDIITQHPEVDAFIMDYYYAFDADNNPIIVHQKAQVVKNDGCVTWVGKLHEDFKQNREMSIFRIEGVERIHFTNEHRVEGNKRRNYQIAVQMVHEDPEEPRAYFNLGNAAYAVGEKNKAIEAFEKFLTMSKSDDEKYIARLRCAEIFWQSGDLTRAVDEAKRAIGEKPFYPDAYHLLGVLYFEEKRYLESIAMIKEGLNKKPPVLEIIVFNPREYDYMPLMNLAKAYYELHLPNLALDCLNQCAEVYPTDTQVAKLIENMKPEAEQFEKVLAVLEPLKKMADSVINEPDPIQRIKRKEALKAHMDDLPDDIQDHPIIVNIRNVNFIKTVSSGKDISIYCGFTEEKWNPDTIKKTGIGGSEEAVYWLANLFAEKGYNVTVFNNSGSHKDLFYKWDKSFKTKVKGSVTYRPFWTWNFRDKQDIVILWRHPKALDYSINASQVYVDMHDTLPASELTKSRCENATKILVKSEFHRKLYPNVPDEKIAVIGNGIDADAYEKLDTSKKEDGLIVCTSTANRCLSALLECLPEIRKEVPNAHIKWAYGWKTIEEALAGLDHIQSWVKEMKAQMAETEGFEDLGRLNHAEIASLLASSRIYGYPTEFAEIFCISAVKAQAAGCVPVTVDFGALSETVQFGVKVKPSVNDENWTDAATNQGFDFSTHSPEVKKEFIKAIVHELKNPRPDEYVDEMKAWATKNYAWTAIADAWDKEFTDAKVPADVVKD